MSTEKLANGSNKRTGVLGLRDGLGEQLCKVRNVFAKEACLKNKSLPGMVGLQLTSQQFTLAGNSQGGSLVGVL